MLRKNEHKTRNMRFLWQNRKLTGDANATAARTRITNDVQFLLRRSSHTHTHTSIVGRKIISQSVTEDVLCALLSVAAAVLGFVYGSKTVAQQQSNYTDKIHLSFLHDSLYE